MQSLAAQRFVQRLTPLEYAQEFLDSWLPTMLVEAKAGQGKTIFAQQVMEMVPLHGMCSCTADDKDIFVFFNKLVDGLSPLIPAPEFERIKGLASQLTSPDELLTTGPEALSSAINESPNQFLFVLDDVYLLEGSKSLMLARKCIASLPNHCKTMALTRHKLHIDGDEFFQRGKTYYVNDDILKFSKDETLLLYNDILNKPLKFDELERLLEQTQGWIAGILLHSFQKTNLNTSALPQNIVGSFFSRSSLIPDSCPNEMYLLGYFENIQESFIEKYATPTTKKLLDRLVRKNFFIRIAKASHGYAYIIHHSFREYLIEKAASCPEEEKQTFFGKTGRYYLETEQKNVALRFFSMAENFDTMENIISDNLFELAKDNRHSSLRSVIDGLPPQIVNANPWFLLAKGLCLNALGSKKSLKALQRATQLFRLNKNDRGELLALALEVHFQLFILGDYPTLEIIILRCEQLYNTHSAALCNDESIQCLNSLAIGFGLVLCNPDKAYHYAEAAEYISKSQFSFAQSRLGKLTALGLRGNLRQLARETNALFGFRHNIFISPSLVFAIETLHLNYLEMRGRFINYSMFRKNYMEKHREILRDSYILPFLAIWDIDASISQGRFDHAFSCIEEHILLVDSKKKHIISQLLHYKALALAILGRDDEALAAGRQALKMRTKIGGYYFFLLTSVLVGGALTLTSHHKTGLRLLDKALKRLEKIDEYSLKPTAHFYRASLLLKRNKSKAALQDIRKGLDQLEHFKTYHFFGWHPKVMERVLSTAVSEDINRSYARKLAARALDVEIEADGTVIPRLTIIANGSRVSIESPRGKLAPSDINNKIRNLLSFVAIAPELSITIEEALDAVWPETPHSKGRASFDTAVRRLRKQLEAKLGVCNGKLHVSVKNGLISLQHCKLLVSDIMEEKRLAQDLIASQQPWQAHCAFERMQALVEKLPEYPSNLSTFTSPPTLEYEYMNALSQWAVLLMDANDLPAALLALERACTCNPLDTRAQIGRVQLLNKMNRPGEAALVLKNFRTLLAGKGYSSEEISALIEST